MSARYMRSTIKCVTRHSFKVYARSLAIELRLYANQMARCLNYGAQNVRAFLLPMAALIQRHSKWSRAKVFNFTMGGHWTKKDYCNGV